MFDGYWLPLNIKNKVITSSTEFTSLSFNKGRPSLPGNQDATSARWPILEANDWKVLLDELHRNRLKAPKGKDLWNRLQSAFKHVGRRLANPEDELAIQVQQSLPNYTGFSPAMIQVVSQAIELFALDQVADAQQAIPTHDLQLEWGRIPNLPGRFRFYPSRKMDAVKTLFPRITHKPIFRSPQNPSGILGYGAGNVPGTALLIALLALSTSINGSLPPVTIIRNSRQEPIFSPLILQALEEVDAELVATLAVLVWDYDDKTIQDTLLTQVDLVIAAASDETIYQIQSQIDLYKQKSGKRIRFIPHGHKVSFSTIFSDVVSSKLPEPGGQIPILDIVCLLAGLDSIFWDQFGCLSSRFHFVEENNVVENLELSSAHRYAQKLEEQLSILSKILPRGNWPIQPLHDRFDALKQLEKNGQVKVYSKYDDPYLVALDHRALSDYQLHKSINECQGRIIIIRPVSDVMQIPRLYLKSLPSTNLQSMNIAHGHKDEGLTNRFLQFSSDCGKCGITSIRTVGRGAFPQLPYSWDGFIPLDLTSIRFPGYFTTIEFEKPMNQILETYDLYRRNYLP
ncbi:MAG TPA: acyl-CoA reductase [Anaerolineales bacterium]|nr:acyl-CoA reductase [Anaerolineales bacterium]